LSAVTCAAVSCSLVETRAYPLVAELTQLGMEPGVREAVSHGIPDRIAAAGSQR